MTENALCFLLLEVQSFADILKVRCSDQGDTGVNIYMEKICWALHIHKQGNSVWVFQEEQNERLIHYVFCCYLIQNNIGLGSAAHHSPTVVFGCKSAHFMLYTVKGKDC